MWLCLNAVGESGANISYKTDLSLSSEHRNGFANIKIA